MCQGLFECRRHFLGREPVSFLAMAAGGPFKLGWSSGWRQSGRFGPGLLPFWNSLAKEDEVQDFDPFAGTEMFLFGKPWACGLTWTMQRKRAILHKTGRALPEGRMWMPSLGNSGRLRLAAWAEKSWCQLLCPLFFEAHWRSCEPWPRQLCC